MKSMSLVVAQGLAIVNATGCGFGSQSSKLNYYFRFFENVFFWVVVNTYNYYVI